MRTSEGPTTRRSVRAMAVAATVALVTLASGTLSVAFVGTSAGAATSAGGTTTGSTTGSTTVQLTDPMGNHHLYRHGAVPRRSVRHGEVATDQRSAASTSEAAKLSAKLLRYGGGASGLLSGAGVTTGQPRVYLVFYGDQWGTASTNGASQMTFSNDSAHLAPALQTFYAGLGTNGETWSGVLTQYCDGASVGATSCSSGDTNIPYPTSQVLAGVWYDSSAGATSATAAGATGHDLALAAEAAAAHFSNSTQASNRDAQYVIVSPTGANPDGWNDPVSGYCAYHDDTEDPGITGAGPVSGPVIAFTNLPYVPDAGASCGAGSVNSPGTLDGATEAASHEYAETLTDQFPGYSPIPGWISANGSENGDLCAYAPVTSPGPAFNLVLSTGTVAVQGTWSNIANGGKGACSDGEPTFVYRPSVSGFSPLVGPAGSTVTISGTNLGGVTSVTIGGVTALPTSVSTTQVTAIVPTDAANGPIVVNSGSLTASSAKSFNLTPTITSFTPGSGSAGTSVTIHGSGLAGAKKVTVGGKAATVVTDQATQIVVTTASKSVTGQVVAKTKYGTAVAPGVFTVP